ncbi:electron transfer flavoprotein subunit alpha/FixB family protein [Heliophilum fasciatum]|uniref:Electron transfer flavoprotein alpha subunit apoprotein n=1 Tax=Heliophilum fasciatum TaxID=35700 RepID=A0A4R2RH80_9FIRM|nr:electron transfer flavoprotein subunit alpha/FixB family protein [Heliophilum fasciatum]MCW2279080.1 electron transfer flavoprotein alpha subunit [Heliophilum fasciatum]TCP61477.1 electron transfer flavoprotein alpha subunit apoprotein [Heliophilum fasciatum]
MAKVWVVVEAKEGQIKKVTYEMIGLASQLGEVEAVVVGSGVKDLAPGLGAYGVGKVYVVDQPELAEYTTARYTRVLAELIGQEQPAKVLIANTAQGRDFAPRVAQRLGLGQISDVTGYEQGQFVRPIYSGKALAQAEAVAAQAIITVRPNVFNAVSAGAGTAEVVERTVALQPNDLLEVVREVAKQVSVRPELTEANIICSGGRGLKEPANFKLIEDLADVLGAAVGASRAAVDAGWRHHSFQVGQTGKTVSPQVYFAIGISGAIQHLAGMGSSKVIVAINKDPEANIFKVADYGIVGDLFEVVPVLTEELRKALA